MFDVWRFDDFFFLSLISDVGDIAPFSYFSQPVNYVGNKVQYEPVTQLPIQQQLKVEPKIVPVEVDDYTPIPDEITPNNIPGELQTQDEVYYPEDDTSDSEFYYYDDLGEVSVTPTTDNPPKSLPTQNSEEPVSYYYKDLPDSYSNHGESVAKPYLSYPSYPPLAPAPPQSPYGSKVPNGNLPPRGVTPSHITAPQQYTDTQYFQEVPASVPTQYKRDSGPILSYKSAYTSQDLDAPSNPQQPQINEPQTLLGPDGSVFYLEDVSEDTPSAEPREVFDNQATPSPVYYKYPSSDTALEYPRQETLSGADYAPSAPNVVPPVPTPEPVVYYREVPPQVTPNEKPSSPKVVTPKMMQNSRLPLQTQILEEFSGEPSYEDDITSESKTTVSFNTPNMNFEIPSEFRTFLNTPPRWINLDNW